MQSQTSFFCSFLHGSEQSLLWIWAGKTGLNFGDVPLKRALLCWYSARLLSLDFQCRGGKHNEGIHRLWPDPFFYRAHGNEARPPQPRREWMTFRRARSWAAALWPALISWCHRKWIVSMMTVTSAPRFVFPVTSSGRGGLGRRGRRRSGTISRLCSVCTYMCM